MPQAARPLRWREVVAEMRLTQHQNPDLPPSPASPLFFLPLSDALLLPDSLPLFNPPTQFYSDYGICIFPSFRHCGLLCGPFWFWSLASWLVPVWSSFLFPALRIPSPGSIISPDPQSGTDSHLGWIRSQGPSSTALSGPSGCPLKDSQTSLPAELHKVLAACIKAISILLLEEACNCQREHSVLSSLKCHQNTLRVVLDYRHFTSQQFTYMVINRGIVCWEGCFKCQSAPSQLWSSWSYDITWP